MIRIKNRISHFEGIQKKHLFLIRIQVNNLPFQIPRLFSMRIVNFTYGIRKPNSKIQLDEI